MLPTGTVTFLLTDIEGSTPLWEKQPEAMKAALASHDAILRAAIEAWNGQVIKSTGDGIHAVFPTALEALQATIQAQTVLQSPLSNLQIKVRMGLHTGEAELRDGDYFGNSLNRTGRIMAVGYGGQILLSDVTAGLVREALPAETSLKDMGEHRLKGLSNPEHLWQVVAPGLPGGFPALQSLSTLPNNLPLQLTSFIGREKERAEIKDLLHSARLVTLTGSGGTGKTRLSLEVGGDLLTAFPQGVWLIELAPLTNPEQVIPALAQMFGLQNLPFRSPETMLMDSLRDKKLLMILDNCEHLIATCARLVEELLRHCAGLKVLASSREALGIAGEVAYRIPSLAESESNCLFEERARAAKPGFALTAENAASVTQICTRLDGIPLAIELAAARIRLFSPEQIASRLDDRFKLLTGGSRTALPRQQTLRALIDWSYDILGEEERQLLRRLSVFAGGWTFEAAEFVCPTQDVLELLAQLINKSLVVVDNDGSESTRYHLLETIRQYARDKLLEVGEALEVRSLHGQYYLQLAETAEPKLYRADSAKLVRLLEDERDNFRVSLEWTRENEIESALRIVYALQIFWIRNGYQAEWRILAETMIATAEALPPLEGEAAIHRNFLIARALSTLSGVAMNQGDNQYVREVTDKCEAYAREIGNKGMVARALSYNCSVHLAVGDVEGVEIWSEKALRYARQSDDPFALGMSLGVSSEYLLITDKEPEKAREYASQSTKILKDNGMLWAYAIIWLMIGMAAKYKGDFGLSRESFRDILPLFQEMGDIQRMTMIQSEFGHMDRYEGQLDKAEQAYRETIQVWQKLGHRAAVANQLEFLAYIAMAHAQDERAARLLGAAEALREKIKIPMSQFERAEYNQQVAGLRGRMQEEIFSTTWAEGRLLPMEQAVAFARQPTGEGNPKQGSQAL
jgi:predicted ATPase/class 3 adenylate cyclase